MQRAHFERLFVDHDRESHFEEVRVSLSPKDFAPPAGPLNIAALPEARSRRFVGAFPDWHGGEPHPSPRLQFFCTMTGEYEVTASDVFADPDQRNRGVGIMFSAAGMGAVAGIPALTLLSALATWQWAVDSLLAPTSLLPLGAALLPHRELVPVQGSPWANYVSRYQHVLRHAEVNWLLVASVLRNLVWNVPLIYGVSIWVGEYHLSLQSYGWLFAPAGMVYFIGSNVAPALLHRFSADRVFIGGAFVLCIAGRIFGLTAGNLISGLAIYCGVIASTGAFVAVALNVLMQDVLSESRGAILSLNGTTSWAGAAVAGMLGGLLLATLGAASLVPLTSLLVPFAALACWLSVHHRAVLSAADAEATQNLAD